MADSNDAAGSSKVAIQHRNTALATLNRVNRILYGVSVLFVLLLAVPIVGYGADRPATYSDLQETKKDLERKIDGWETRFTRQWDWVSKIKTDADIYTSIVEKEVVKQDRRLALLEQDRGYLGTIIGWLAGLTLGLIGQVIWTFVQGRHIAGKQTKRKETQ